MTRRDIRVDDRHHLWVAPVFDPGGPDDYDECVELTHPDDCPTTTVLSPFDVPGERKTYTQYECLPGALETYFGLSYFFVHRDDPRAAHGIAISVEPGTAVPVRAWVSEPDIRTGEVDSGMELLTTDDEKGC